MRKTQLSPKQKASALELKAIKIGIVVFLALLFMTNFFVAGFISVYFSVLLGFFLKLKERLPVFYRNKHRIFPDDDALEAHHKRELIDAPVTSALSPYRNAGSGYQIYHHHSQFHR